MTEQNNSTRGAASPDAGTIEPADALTQAAAMIGDAFARGNRLYLCGNGGSAADCEHIAGELLKSFLLPRPLCEPDRAALDTVDPAGKLSANLQGALPVFSLVSQTAFLTAWSNDADPDCVFAQQIYGYGVRGDVLLCFSTSGNSENIRLAALAAKAKGVLTVLVTGEGGGTIARIADLTVRLPAGETARIQELTMPFYHRLCAMLEARFFGAEETEDFDHGSL